MMSPFTTNTSALPTVLNNSDRIVAVSWVELTEWVKTPAWTPFAVQTTKAPFWKGFGLVSRKFDPVITTSTSPEPTTALDGDIELIEGVAIAGVEGVGVGVGVVVGLVTELPSHAGSISTR